MMEEKRLTKQELEYRILNKYPIDSHYLRFADEFFDLVDHVDHGVIFSPCKDKPNLDIYFEEVILKVKDRLFSFKQFYSDKELGVDMMDFPNFAQILIEVKPTTVYSPVN